MIVTNEPGYYADGKYGIRIESVLIVKEVETPWNFGDKGFLGFECATMYVFFYHLCFACSSVLVVVSFMVLIGFGMKSRCPIQTKLVDQKLISSEGKV